MKRDTRINLNESFEEFDFSIIKAIVGLTGMDEEEAKKLETEMDFSDYINLIMAIERDNNQAAKDILSDYYEFESVSLESIVQEISYLIKEDADNVLIPSFMKLENKELMEVLSRLDHKQTQKILANLRGFKSPGYHEMSGIQSNMNEEIASLLYSGAHKLNELVAPPPGTINRIQAYGEETPEDEEEEKEAARQTQNQSQDDEIEQNEKDIEELKRRAGLTT